MARWTGNKKLERKRFSKAELNMLHQEGRNGMLGWDFKLYEGRRAPQPAVSCNQNFEGNP